jgi:HPr kinase/phosphorylase
MLSTSGAPTSPSLLKPAQIHAGCVLVGDAGLLIRGASGSGKSSLGLSIMALAAVQRRFARLVSDDRTSLTPMHGRLIAACLPVTAGLAERRGLGLAPVVHEPRAIIRLVVDCLGEEPTRMPEPEALVVEILGVTLPRICVHGQDRDAALVLAALELFAQ